MGDFGERVLPARAVQRYDGESAPCKRWVNGTCWVSGVALRVASDCRVLGVPGGRVGAWEGLAPGWEYPHSVALMELEESEPSYGCSPPSFPSPMASQNGALHPQLQMGISAWSPRLAFPTRQTEVSSSLLYPSPRSPLVEKNHHLFRLPSVYFVGLGTC